MKKEAIKKVNLANFSNFVASKIMSAPVGDSTGCLIGKEVKLTKSKFSKMNTIFVNFENG